MQTLLKRTNRYNGGDYDDKSSGTYKRTPFRTQSHAHRKTDRSSDATH